MEGEVIYWSIFSDKKWSMYIAATKDGLSYIGTPNAEFEELEKWAKKRLPKYTLVEDASKLSPYTSELIEYLNGDCIEFTLKMDLHGTPFQQSVWKALQEIPYGQTVSYTDIANRIGKPKSVRAVGTAIGANPVLMSVPCHRVIAKSGALTGFRAGLNMKEQLLELEKVNSSR
ncbi:methylated-DNA--[protein]-cysteine S-methyltransferase [Sporosarcina siberiensis]|uniref:Methylated-DNA--[protein]-cysteine S-methyltransferase n=1 Tax=Sporosarcina siberiensis TaxID=1365606 RepID=A0ABW4SLH9_9BACL